VEVKKAPILLHGLFLCNLMKAGGNAGEKCNGALTDMINTTHLTLIAVDAESAWAEKDDELAAFLAKL
jgi:hypothetical protein